MRSDIPRQHASRTANQVADGYKTSEEKSGADSPIFHAFYSEGGNNSVKPVIDFTPVEFTELLMSASASLVANFNTGCAQQRECSVRIAYCFEARSELEIYSKTV